MAIESSSSGKKIIYALLKRTFYGVLIRALFFWRYLVMKLKYWGFQKNHYDLYTMNKVIDGSLCAVCWHVDDLKISHVKSTVVDDILRLLEEYNGKVSLLTNTQGNINDYLGMVLYFINKGQTGAC